MKVQELNWQTDIYSKEEMDRTFYPQSLSSVFALNEQVNARLDQISEQIDNEVERLNNIIGQE